MACRDDEKLRLQAGMDSASCLMLRDHGLFACGKTIVDAFPSMYAVENSGQRLRGRGWRFFAVHTERHLAR